MYFETEFSLDGTVKHAQTIENVELYLVEWVTEY